MPEVQYQHLESWFHAVGGQGLRAAEGRWLHSDQLLVLFTKDSQSMPVDACEVSSACNTTDLTSWATPPGQKMAPFLLSHHFVLLLS